MAGSPPVEESLEALYEATRHLMTAGSEGEVCEAAVTAVVTIFDGRPGRLLLYDAEAGELQVAATTDRDDDPFEDDLVRGSGEDPLRAAFEAGEVRTHSAGETDSPAAAELVVPLGEHGVLTVASLDRGTFQSADRRIARILAANVEAALARTRREHALRVKNDRLEEFVAIVSHDLRNPLNVADGYLDLARADHDGEALEAVAEAIARMETLVDDLLELAQQGYVVDERTGVDLASVAERAWANVHAPEATLRTEATASVFGDETRLLQAFENLFRNAVEHGGPDVTVRVGLVAPIATSTRVSATDHVDGFYVEDDGPGIPPDEHDAVFESGYSTGGTGLGLAIVQRVVAAHGWKISVQPAVGGGARFEITDGTKSVIPFGTG